MDNPFALPIMIVAASVAVMTAYEILIAATVAAGIPFPGVGPAEAGFALEFSSWAIPIVLLGCIAAMLWRSHTRPRYTSPLHSF